MFQVGHFASWLWRGYQDGRFGVLSSMTIQPIQQVSLVGIIQPAQASGVSDPDRANFSGCPILGPPTFVLTHGRQVAEDRNEPACCQLPTKIVSDSRDPGLAVTPNLFLYYYFFA